MFGFKNEMAFLEKSIHLDVEHSAHSRRTAICAPVIAKAMGELDPNLNVDEAILNGIRFGALIHDIGKSEVPQSILNKDSFLTMEEFDVIKRHTVYGSDIALSFRGKWSDEAFKIAYETCRWHHERIDGSGYPDGLKGVEIPPSAQIVAIADVYDALTHDRVYRKAFSHEEAMEMIFKGHCGPFSELMLASIQKAGPQLKEILETVDLDETPEVMEARQ